MIYKTIYELTIKERQIIVDELRRESRYRINNGYTTYNMNQYTFILSQ